VGWAGLAAIALAEASLAAGDKGVASEEAERGLWALRDQADPFYVGGALRVLGTTQLAMAQLEDARRTLHEAVSIFDAIGARLELAMTQLTLANLAAVSGQAGAAQRALQHALRLCAELELPWWAARIGDLAGALAGP
jgi:tetratricopeptide (TPR) repeat protein